METGKEEYFRAKKELWNKMEALVDATGTIAKPLVGLSEEQVSAVVALNLVSQVLVRARMSKLAFEEDPMVLLRDRLGAVDPGLARMAGADVTSPMMQCMAESIACASALAECEDDDRRDDECPESWGPCAAEIYCVMGVIEDMKGLVFELVGGPVPGPRPPPI